MHLAHVLVKVFLIIEGHATDGILSIFMVPLDADEFGHFY